MDLSLMVEMPSNSPVSLAVNHILEQIRLGQISGGHRLVEADLAAELDIGRSSIREALRILAGDGVIEIIPHKGAAVRRLNEADLIQIYEALSGMHWTSARICARNSANPHLRETLTAACHRLTQVRKAEDHLSWFLALGDYHRELNHLTENAILTREHDRMRNVHFHRELTRYIAIQNWDRYLSTYQALTDAILSGEGDRAGAIIAGHIDTILELLRRPEKPAIYQ
ncbi:GntR family transcriptional regulator [Pseudomonas sp. NPDC089401]|uniref:GntR family transcriptional regulator n=1 Tax=Pseudomonas sp. NPDC089401 TaxID=3364462 RepID=UPI0037F111DE